MYKRQQTAQKTFNPRLGIQGGISILGTSGIVEPMSEKALISSIEVEMKQKASGGKQYLLVAPGNYGLQYLSGHSPFDADEAVKCSNCLLYTSPSPRDGLLSRMPSSA